MATNGAITANVERILPLCFVITDLQRDSDDFECRSDWDGTACVEEKFNGWMERVLGMGMRGGEKETRVLIKGFIYPGNVASAHAPFPPGETVQRQES